MRIRTVTLARDDVGGDNDGENFLSNPSVDYVATFLCKDGFMRMISGCIIVGKGFMSFRLFRGWCNSAGVKPLPYSCFFENWAVVKRGRFVNRPYIYEKLAIIDCLIC